MIFVRNGEECNIKNTVCSEGDLPLTNIVTRNFRED